MSIPNPQEPERHAPGSQRSTAPGDPSPDVRPGGNAEAEGWLDPHRDELVRRASAELASRLEQRGVPLMGNETPEEIGDLLDAVERFESEVESLGGDLFVDTGAAREPDNAAFVLPRRQPGEQADEYRLRVQEATFDLRRRRGDR